MRKFLIITLGLVVAAGIIGYVVTEIPSNEQSPAPSSPQGLQSASDNNEDIPRMSVIAQGFDTPWALEFLPDGGILVTERQGTVRLIKPDGEVNSEPVATIDEVREIGEGGLLGIALHPAFDSNNYVFLYYTYDGNENNTLNRVVRMEYQRGALLNQTIIVDAIPGASNHNGGRIKFGPDGFLYITTGDAQEPSQAQNLNSLAGKILRVTDEGEPVTGNLRGLVYSYGHRNPQGLTWDDEGKLWSTEHGRSGIQSGFDEVNLIEAANNYGWPEIEGDETENGMIVPVEHSGANSTWAPAGAAFFENSVFFGGLRGRTLYEAVVQNEDIIEVREHFTDEYGRIRAVELGPDNMLYITTSNRDGRGNPDSTDDKVIRINPQKL